jgi:hypothetical protein
MAYDAERIRTLLSGRSDAHEQKLFGGLCFMLRGNMCCAASGRGGLLVRVGPDAPSISRRRCRGKQKKAAAKKKPGVARRKK